MPSAPDDLESKIVAFKAAQAAGGRKTVSTDKNADNMNTGVRAGMELVVSIIAGAVIGYFLDRWLDTRPIFLMLFFMVGIGTGFWNVYRITQGLDSAVGFASLRKRGKAAKKTPENGPDNIKD